MTGCEWSGWARSPSLSYSSSFITESLISIDQACEWLCDECNSQICGVVSGQQQHSSRAVRAAELTELYSELIVSSVTFHTAPTLVSVSYTLPFNLSLSSVWHHILS